MAAEFLENGMAQGLADGDGFVKYGAAQARSGPKRKAPREAPPIRVVVGCLVVPLLNIFTLWLMGFWMRYNITWLAWLLSFGMFLFIPLFAYMAFQASRGKGGNSLWLWWLCLLYTASWIAAMVAGNSIYESSIKSFYELYQMNAYESVDPSTSIANQYMDFGIITFNKGAWIDRMFTMGFKNDNMYCVAPIVQFNQTMPKTIDFWAVGTNCCSKHLKNFNCGMWNNPDAHSGVRVLDETERSFYQVAVKQASAAYDIPVNHPVFMYWVESPYDQILGYQVKGNMQFNVDVFIMVLCILGANILAAFIFPKL